MQLKIKDKVLTLRYYNEECVFNSFNKSNEMVYTFFCTEFDAAVLDAQSFIVILDNDREVEFSKAELVTAVIARAGNTVTYQFKCPVPSNGETILRLAEIVKSQQNSVIDPTQG